jgi:hypothetical protein
MGRWVRTAELVYTASEDKYEGMLTLLMGNPAKRMTRVSLCAEVKGSAPNQRCELPGSVRSSLGCDAGGADTVWFAKIQSHRPLRGDRYRCVVRTTTTTGSSSQAQCAGADGQR